MQEMLSELDRHTNYSVPLPGYQTLLNIMDNYLSNLYTQLHCLPRNRVWATILGAFPFSQSSISNIILIPRELQYGDKKLDGLLVILEYCSKYHSTIHQKGRVSPFLLGVENEETKKDLEEIFQRIDLVPFFTSLIPHVSCANSKRKSLTL